MVTKRQEAYTLFLFEQISAAKRLDLNNHGYDCAHHKEHIPKHINYPCEVTGIEDFDWEECYLLGPGSEFEYEKIKKNQPILYR
jgi:hypothetical protein